MFPWPFVIWKWPIAPVLAPFSCPYPITLYGLSFLSPHNSTLPGILPAYPFDLENPGFKLNSVLAPPGSLQ